jgi:hypothetical protein
MKLRREEDQGHNPYLKATVLEVVQNQLEANDPPEAREAFNRLTSQGISEEDAKIYIAQAMCVEIYDVLKYKKLCDLKRYARNLKRLPKEPKE